MNDEPGALERLERDRARDVRGFRQAPRAHEPERAERRHELRPVDEREPLLRLQRHRCETGSLERVPARQAFAVEPRLTLPDEREREMCERSQVAAGTDRASARHDRQDAPVEALEQELDELRARAGASLGERVGAQEHRRPHDLVGIGVADPTGVAPQQAQLELLRQLLRNGLGDEAPEAGVDAVRVLAAPVRGPVDNLPGSVHLRARRVRENGPRTSDGHCPDVVDRQVVARQGVLRDHRPSLTRGYRQGFPGWPTPSPRCRKRASSAGAAAPAPAWPGSRADLPRPPGCAREGLLLVAPLFAVLAPQAVFAGAAVALALVGIAGAGAALVVSSRRAA